MVTTEMQLLSLNFLLYSISGVWRPIEWSLKISKFLYGVFTFFTIYLVLFLLVTHLLDIIVVVDNVEDFASVSFILISSTGTLFKAIAAVTRREQIISLINTLQKKPCKACNEEENGIQGKFDRLIRSCSISYMILATFSVTGAVAGGVMNILGGQLPFNVWVPWDCTSFFLFWFTSLQEIAAMIIGTVVNVASETLIFGFCLQICAQFEILKHRLRRMVKPDEKEEVPKDSFNVTSSKTSRLSEHIVHHLCIIRLAEVTNDIFSQVIFIQFFASILILCLSLYHLSSHVTVTDFATLSVFIICMFVQIFVYCWAGNEVILQSTGMSEAAYHMDWTLMTISERKDLLMIMKCSTRPVRFTSSFLVTLSLDSYANLLKASYSAFNILQQS